MVFAAGFGRGRNLDGGSWIDMCCLMMSMNVAMLFLLFSHCLLHLHSLCVVFLFSPFSFGKIFDFHEEESSGTWNARGSEL